MPHRARKTRRVSFSDSIEENIDFHRRVESAYWLSKINSNCRSTSTSSILCQATSGNHKIIREEGLSLINRIDRGGEIRIELLGAKPSFEQRESFKSSFTSTN